MKKYNLTKIIFNKKILLIIEPTDGIEEEYKHFILRVQGNMWSEYVWERTDLQYKIFPLLLSVAEVGWTNPEHKDWPRFLMNYAAHHKEVLAQLGVVDAVMQVGTIGEWKSGELTKDKWISIEFPVENCLNKVGIVEAAFVYKSGVECKVKNVKFLFNGAVVAQDNHEGVISDFPQNSVYKFNTDRIPYGKISIQIDMMSMGDSNCEGVIYEYFVKAANENEEKVKLTK